MNNILNRIFTSIALFIVLYGAIINQHILFMLFTLIGFFVMIEVYRLFKVIFKDDKKKVVLLFLILIIYLLICLPQLFFFITTAWTTAKKIYIVKKIFFNL